jgi:hypothetical protein
MLGWGIYSSSSAQNACQLACGLTHGTEVKACGSDPDRQAVLDADAARRETGCKAKCAFSSVIGNLIPSYPVP